MNCHTHRRSARSSQGARAGPRGPRLRPVVCPAPLTPREGATVRRFAARQPAMGLVRAAAGGDSPAACHRGRRQVRRARASHAAVARRPPTPLPPPELTSRESPLVVLAWEHGAPQAAHVAVRARVRAFRRLHVRLLSRWTCLSRRNQATYNPHGAHTAPCGGVATPRQVTPGAVSAVGRENGAAGHLVSTHAASHPRKLRAKGCLSPLPFLGVGWVAQNSAHAGCIPAHDAKK